MQNHRRTRQPSELNSSRLTRSRQKKPRSVSSSLLLRLLWRGSWLFWGGVLVFLLAITAIAVLSMTHIGDIAQTGSTPVTISTQKPNYSAQTYNHIAVGLLGALIFVTGSVTLGKHLNRASRSYQIRQRQERSAALDLTRHREQRQQFETDRANRETAQADSVSVPSPSFSTQNSSSESLAEMMDIRKRWSLDSILQKTK